MRNGPPRSNRSEQEDARSSRIIRSASETLSYGLGCAGHRFIFAGSLDGSRLRVVSCRRTREARHCAARPRCFFKDLDSSVTSPPSCVLVGWLPRKQGRCPPLHASGPVFPPRRLPHQRVNVQFRPGTRKFRNHHEHELASTIEQKGSNPIASKPERSLPKARTLNGRTPSAAKPSAVDDNLVWRMPVYAVSATGKRALPARDAVGRWISRASTSYIANATLGSPLSRSAHERSADRGHAIA